MALTLRSAKGTLLTHEEMDDNFAHLLTNLSGSEININGGLIVSSGSFVHYGLAEINNLMGNLNGTSSHALQAQTSVNAQTAQTASYALFATTALYVERVPNADHAYTASYTYTSSYVEPLNQTLQINGDIVVTGSATFTDDITIDGFTIGKGKGGHASNLAFGFNALVNTEGTYNLAIGYEALGKNIDGYNNVAVGPNALELNIGGSHNTVLGFNVGTAITSGHYNTIIGNTPGFNVNNNVILSDGQGNIKYRWDGNTNNIYGSLTLQNSTAILSHVSSSCDFANDEEAANGGVPLGGLYHTSGVIKIRLV
jgi:hypothetical protein